MSINRSGTNIVYGLNNPSQGLSPRTIYADRDPLPTDRAQLGSQWINQLANTYFFLTSSQVWTAQQEGSATQATLTITGGAGTVLTVRPSGNTVLGGNLSVAGSSDLAGTINIGGVSTFNSNVNVYADMNISGDLTVSGATIFNGPVTEDSLTLTGLSGTVLDVEHGDTSLGGNLTVYGLANFTDDVTIVGGVTIDTSERVSIISTDNVSNAISLTVNGGTSETIEILSQQGTGANSIALVSDNGGIQLNAAKSIALASTSNAVNAIGITANGGTSETIVIFSNQGTSNTAVFIGAVQGGISLAAKSQITLGTEVDLSHTGNIQINTQRATSATTTVNNNAYFGTCIFTGNTIVSEGSVIFHINNLFITTTTAVMLNVSYNNTSGSNAALAITGQSQVAGTLTFDVTNTSVHTLLSTDNIIVGFQVLL